uniref:prolactin-releasing peptide receptor-like n=1 Tax=Pristiophorus japonicus TaxID=55135 RepID=UPI00398F0268
MGWAELAMPHTVKQLCVFTDSAGTQDEWPAWVRAREGLGICPALSQEKGKRKGPVWKNSRCQRLESPWEQQPGAAGQEGYSATGGRTDIRQQEAEGHQAVPGTPRITSKEAFLAITGSPEGEAQETMETETVGNSSSFFNGSSPVSFPDTDLLQQYKCFFILLYCALVAVACVGNVFLIGCIAADKKLHNATNFFIGNLSLADLLMCLTCVPPTLSYAFEPRGWLFGRLMCHFVSLMQSATVYVSVLSLAAIAVDRYVVVAYPIHQRITRHWFGLIIGAIWMVSLALASPASVHTWYLEFSAVDFNACGESWPSLEQQRLAYSCVVLLLSYMVPLAAVTISYCAITVHLRRRNDLREAGRDHVRWSRGKRKTFLLLVISVLVFGVCWLPLQILNLIIDADVNLTVLNYKYVKVLHLSCHWLAMSSSCYNPFIYASLHQKFRLHLRGYAQQRKRNSSFMSSISSPSHAAAADLLKLEMANRSGSR